MMEVVLDFQSFVSHELPRPLGGARSSEEKQEGLFVGAASEGVAKLLLPPLGAPGVGEGWDGGTHGTKTRQ